MVCVKRQGKDREEDQKSGGSEPSIKAKRRSKGLVLVRARKNPSSKKPELEESVVGNCEMNSMKDDEVFTRPSFERRKH
jgi:hypothetical protein